MTAFDKKMVQFARDVIFTLQENDEWSGDIVDSIASSAIKRKLAKLGKDGYFVTNFPSKKRK